MHDIIIAIILVFSPKQGSSKTASLLPIRSQHFNWQGEQVQLKRVFFLLKREWSPDSTRDQNLASTALGNKYYFIIINIFLI